MKIAIAKQLTYWQDPQGDVLLFYSERDCNVYFGCWLQSGEPADFACKLTFYDTGAIRSYPREFLPYQIKNHEYHSKILLVEDSDMLKEYKLYRTHQYPNDKRPLKQLLHFIVVGHDIYHEILPEKYEEQKVMIHEITDDRVRNLILNA